MIAGDPEDMLEMSLCNLESLVERFYRLADWARQLVHIKVS